MYNHFIDTFLYVVEVGSFHGASEKLHISSTGISKQMTSLENTLNVKLFERGTQGINLTRAGKVFLHECQRLIEVSEELISKTRTAVETESEPVRVGVTPVIPIDEFNRICRADEAIRKHGISIVLYRENVNSAFPNPIHDLKYAEISFSCGGNAEDFSEMDFLPFSQYKLTCAVPLSHPLTKKEKLQPADLRGETLLFPSRSNYEVTTGFKYAVEKEFPDITVEIPFLFYDSEVFNRCVKERKILISFDCWNNIHPGLVNIPVEWDWTMPYGLIWKKDARQEVLDFIAAFREAVKKEKEKA